MINRLRVQSETDQSKTYLVTLLFGEPVACTCPHFNFRADAATFTCKHMRSTRAVVSGLTELLARG